MGEIVEVGVVEKARNNVQVIMPNRLIARWFITLRDGDTVTRKRSFHAGCDTTR